LNRLRITVLLFVAALSSPAAAQSAKGSGGESKAPATVVVVNRLERAVTIWIGDEMKGRVESSGEARFSGIPAGQVSLKAGAVGSAGPVAGEERSLGSGETFTWTLYPVLTWGEEKQTGTLVVRNMLDREVEVSFGGSPAGRLGPGATRAYPRVVAGDVVVSAQDDDGNVVGERDLSIVPGSIARWDIGGKEDGAAPRADAEN
jgi:hypothetical protein